MLSAYGSFRVTALHTEVSPQLPVAPSSVFPDVIEETIQQFLPLLALINALTLEKFTGDSMSSSPAATRRTPRHIAALRRVQPPRGAAAKLARALLSLVYREMSLATP